MQLGNLLPLFVTNSQLIPHKKKKKKKKVIPSYKHSQLKVQNNQPKNKQAKQTQCNCLK